MYNYKKRRNNAEEESEDESLGQRNIFSKSNIFDLLSSKNNDEDSGKKNHIYFYDDVTKHSALDLCKKIKNTGVKLQELSLRYDLEEPPKIYLHINSYGGDVGAAFTIIDTIIQSSVPVVTIVEGSCASSATLISVAGHERWMNEYAYFLIHQLRGGQWGTMHELDDEHDNHHEFMRRIKQHYKRFSDGKCSKNIDEILKHDIWWTAKDALEHGLIDKIITGTSEEIGNCVNVSKKKGKTSKRRRT